MSYILDDLAALGVDEMVFVVGYLREAIESYIADAYPNITAHYVVQDIQDGTAGAVSLAESFVDEDVLILFVDTLFDADLGLVRGVAETTGGVIWAKEVGGLPAVRGDPHRRRGPHGPKSSRNPPSRSPISPTSASITSGTGSSSSRESTTPSAPAPDRPESSI